MIKIFNKHLVPVAYSLVVLSLIFLHDSFEEFDGAWQLFAGERILRTGEYTGWGSHFWPPLYSFFLGIGSTLTSGFFAGKLLSGVAAIGILYIAFYFGEELFSHQNAGLLAQLLVVSTPIFIKNSFIVENHTLDAFFVLASLYFIYSYSQTEQTETLILAALFGGLGSLTRYTSLIIGPVAIILIVITQLRKSETLKDGFKQMIIYSSIYTSTFFLIQLPWLYFNFLQNGSPLHTWQYLNIGSAVVPTDSWWWYGQSEYSGLFDIISDYPVLYVENFIVNFIKSGYFTLRFAGILAIAYILVLLKSVYNLTSRRSILLLSFGFGYTLLTSQAFVFPSFYLHISVLFAILSVGIILQLTKIEMLQDISINPEQVVIILLAVNLLITAPTIGGYLMNDDTDGGQMTEHNKIAQSLNEYDSNIDEKYVLEVNPAQAYYTGSRHMQFPGTNKWPLSDVLCHAYSPKIENFGKSRAIPPANNSDKLSADYVVLNPWFAENYPEYRYMFNPENESVPESFEVVYQSDQVVVYDVQRYVVENC
jgi:hypothetical protein